jgi:hypothetical protein
MTHAESIRIVEEFLSNIKVPGVCGFWVDHEQDEIDDRIGIYIYIDKDYLKNHEEQNKGYISSKIRTEIRLMIENYTNIKVYVGSVAKDCRKSESLSESMATHVKRRITDGEILDELNTILDYDFYLSDFEDVTDCVEEVCNSLNEKILDYIWEETGRKVSLKEKDELYWYFFNKFKRYIARRYRESLDLNESIVYDYEEGRNESLERLPFDINKLVNAGAVFVTPAIEGDPDSKHYKKFLKKPHTHLITLHNVKHSSPDSWIHTAITRSASTKHWQGKDFSKNLYDGKYNQILWSLDKLGIPYESMLIDDVNESKKKYVVTESQYNMILESRKYIDFFKKLIDNEIDYIRKECEDGMIDFPDYSNDEHCTQLEELEKIVVIDADWVTIMHSNKTIEQKYMHVKLMVYYSSIRRGDFDADDIAYELERRLRLSTGMPLIINYESTNTNTFFEW